MGINTFYNIELSNQSVIEYLDYLINKVFALLPKFEESNSSEQKKEAFEIYQKNLIQMINGNMDLINYDCCITVEILSYLQSLLNISTHEDYRRHVLKICNLISSLKKEVIKDGL
jgi:hypothetical protein